MAESRGAASNTDLKRAFGDVRKQAGDVADEMLDAARDLYTQAGDSASRVAGATTKAAGKTTSSFEVALRNTIENQPYTAVMVAMAVGWLIGRMHRPV